MLSKKVLSLTLAALVGCSVFVGCGSKKEDTASKPVDAKKEVQNMNKTGLPIAKEKVTIKMLAVPYPEHAKFDDMPFFKELERKTNVHVEWQLIPSNMYNEKKNLLFAANELPDAFFGATSFGMDEANKYGSDGTIVALDGLIDAYAPNYKEQLKKLPMLGGMSTAFDGKKYTMGTVIESDSRNYPDNLYINKAWLDKLNLKVPTTIDEYFEVLKAFKEKDPNGNGKKDEIPYSFLRYHHILGYGSFFGAFGRIDAFNGPNGTPLDHFVVESDRVVFTADKQEYKEAIKTLHKFFKEGLFDKEGFTQDTKQFNAKAKSPEMTLGSFYGWSTAVVSPETAKNYVAIAPLKGPSAKEPVVKKRLNNINFLPGGFAITKNNKHPEISVRWIDQFYEMKTGLEAQVGPVGVTITDKGNGNYDYMTPPQGMSLGEFIAKNTPFDIAPKVMTKDVVGKNIPFQPSELEKADVIKKFYANAKQSETLPPVTFKPEEIKVNSTIGTDIGNLVKDKQCKWLLEGGIDEEWDAYVAKLKQLKLEQFTKQMQTVYDRTMGKK